MALQQTMPDNLSFLSPTGFKFSIQKLPHVNYFCTSATIPDITLGQVDQDNLFIKIPVPGDKLTFSPLELRFQVDEDMKNFKEIYDWLEGLGYPDNFQQRANLQAALQATNTHAGKTHSDGSLLVTTAQYQPNIEIKFIDLYPISIGGLEFNVQNSEVEYLQGSVSFAYRKYSIDIIK
tara:strand:+ start:364 stop:897 length:534 start_codon:yes stop_codon:yes gene_type:complete